MHRKYCVVNNMYLSAITIFNQLSSVVTEKEILWPSSFSGISLKEFTRKTKDNFYHVLVRPIGWTKECGIWLRLKEENGNYLPCEGYMKVPNVVTLELNKNLYSFVFDGSNIEIYSFPDKRDDAETSNNVQQRIMFEFEFVLSNL